MFLATTGRRRDRPFDDALSDPASHEPAEGAVGHPAITVGKPDAVMRDPGGDGIARFGVVAVDRGAASSRREPLIGARQWCEELGPAASGAFAC